MDTYLPQRCVFLYKASYIKAARFQSVLLFCVKDNLFFFTEHSFKSRGPDMRTVSCPV
jgi:hypothetical protein